MNKPQILIVEDDNAVANLIAATLETQDYAYKRAENGSEAVMEALSCKPDVVLLDLGLPDMDGVEIIRKIRSWSNMPIIVVSMNFWHACALHCAAFAMTATASVRNQAPMKTAGSALTTPPAACTFPIMKYTLHR